MIGLIFTMEATMPVGTSQSIRAGAGRSKLLGLLFLAALTACGGGGSSDKTPVADPVPVITNFSAAPASIDPGASATLAWSVTGATNLSIDHAIGDVTGQSSVSVHPTVTTAYKLTATNAAGAKDTAIALITVSGSPVQTGFVLKTLSDRAYSVYVPATYNDDASKTWPLIVFQHGSGECGTDGTAQTNVGLGPQIRNHPDWFPCIVLFPQVDSNWNNPWEAQYNLTLSEYRIDTTHVFMTGLSLGGMATWNAGATYPERFAALMPISATTIISDEGITNLAQNPIRAFIGENDGIFDIPQLQTLVAAIQAKGGDIQLTIFPGVGHNAWDAVYSDRTNIDWLLSHSR